MRADDLGAVSRIAAEVHPSYFERDEIFAERLALDPQGCHVLTMGETIAGYIISHPWRAFDPPPLDSLLGRLPDVPATYYLHDIALLPMARGHAAAQIVIATLEARARALGIPHLSLVTIASAAAFWRQMGFVPTEDGAVGPSLKTYGDGALYMTRETAPHVTRAGRAAHWGPVFGKRRLERRAGGAARQRPLTGR